MTMVAYRSEVSDYLYPFDIDSYTFTVPQLKHRLYIDLTNIFDSITWILLFTSLILLFIAINLLTNKAKYNFTILWHLSTIMLKQSLSFKSRKCVVVRMIIMTWLMMCFILITYYSNIIYSVITKPQIVKIRSIDELADACDVHHVQILMHQGALYHWIKMVNIYL